MAGPNIQIPASASQVFDFQRDASGAVVTINMKPEWAALFSSLQQAAVAGSRNGSTSARPTDNFEGRYVGMCFMDMTLGKPVFLKYASSNIWVDATGAPA